MELLDRLLGFGFERIVLPFIGVANLVSMGEAEQAFARVSALAGHGVEFAIESTLPADALRTSLEGKPLGVCYDQGSTTALGYDIVREIHTLGSRITHVHVKDKRRSDGVVREVLLLGFFQNEDFSGLPRATERKAFAQLADLT